MLNLTHVNKNCPKCGHLHLEENDYCEKCLFHFVQVDVELKPQEGKAHWMADDY